VSDFILGEGRWDIRGLVLAVAVEEYRALRAEVVNAVERQYSLANWGVSSIAILLAATAGSWDHLRMYPNILVTLLAFGIPTIGTIYALAWSSVIEKIAVVGWYLFHLETKVTQLFTPDDIKTAFHRTSAAGDPYWYLLGWEHTLWASGTQRFIERVTKLVTSLLAVGYLGAIVGGVVILSHLGGMSPAAALRKPTTIMSSFLWLSVWAWLAHHLIVRTRAQKERVARGVAAERTN
jgi:hypothetical protein